MTSQAEYAAQHDGDAPVPYMARTRDYYQALGHAPYRWARHDAVPFQPLPRPLAACRVALVTTAAPFDPAKGDQGPGAAYNAAAKFYQVYSLDSATDPDLRISHIAYDRQHSPATDPQAWLPLRALRRAVAAGRIGALAPRLHGAPTSRSQRHTTEVDAPELLRRLSAHVHAQLCALHEHAVLLGRKSALERVATFVMHCVPGRGGFNCSGPRCGGDSAVVRLGMTRQEIADYLGLTLETVSRAFSELRRRGIIAIDKQEEVRVHDVCRICQLTGAH